jgi:hypothetical protein
MSELALRRGDTKRATIDGRSCLSQNPHLINRCEATCITRLNPTSMRFWNTGHRRGAEFVASNDSWLRFGSLKHASGSAK